MTKSGLNKTTANIATCILPILFWTSICLLWGQTVQSHLKSISGSLFLTDIWIIFFPSSFEIIYTKQYHIKISPYTSATFLA